MQISAGKKYLKAANPGQKPWITGLYTNHSFKPFAIMVTYCNYAKMKLVDMRRIVCLMAILVSLSCSTDADNGMNQQNEDTRTADVVANRQAVGASAHDMLSGADFSSIVFELYYVNGMEPDAISISNFEDFLSDRLNKPGGVTINLKNTASPGQDRYSIDDIRELEDGLRTSYNKDGQVAVFGIFIDGEYDQNTENSSVLGVAYRNTSFAIFGETIRQFSSSPLAPAHHVLETTVLQHEFGHLLGLVNAGSTPQEDHQDIEHGRHCNVQDCLMYWAAETGEGLLNLVTGGTVPELDTSCLADLKANGGK